MKKNLCVVSFVPQGGPCGVLATVQAILKHLLSTLDSSDVASVYVM